MPLSQLAATTPAPPALNDAVGLSSKHADALVRLIETAPSVTRRPQFFLWSQASLHSLLPHLVLVCGAYARHRRALLHSVFQSVVISPPALQDLSEPTSALMKACVAEWLVGGGKPLVLNTEHFAGQAQAQAARLQSETGPMQLLVHAVARPQRLSELESFFVLLCPGPGTESEAQARLTRHLEFLTPCLHATWRRVMSTDFALGSEQPAQRELDSVTGRVPLADPQKLTEREHEILIGAREGKSNLQIGQDLNISALTVKNHIQKILRKLGARNRAHAVALAMARGLFASSA
jgi:transcriptional regulator EpsA